MLCLALVEISTSVARRQPRRAAAWLLVHLPVAGLSIWLYRLWHFSRGRYTDYFRQYATDSLTAGERFFQALASPVMELNYLYPMLLLIPPLMAVAFSPSLRKRLQDTGPYLYLAATACLLCVFLFATGIYTPQGTRHNLWMLPFFIVPCGYGVATLAQRLRPRANAASVVLALAALLLYEATV